MDRAHRNRCRRSRDRLVKVRWTKRARKALAKLPPSALTETLAARIDALADGLGLVDIKRLKSSNRPLYRLRFGDVRVLATIETGVLTVEDVVMRKDAY